MTTVRTTCCVAGGGPAGIMTGLLLARAGVDVVVLEKHADFLRDFRGDTIHPSTMEILAELGLLEEFLALPHQQLPRLSIVVRGQEIPGPDFSTLRTKARFIGLIPQWDFLDYLVRHASGYPGFSIRMQTRVTGIIETDGRVAGVTAETEDGPIRVEADLVIGADGRHSTLRAASGLPLKSYGVPIDVLWFRIGRPENFTGHTIGHFANCRMMVTIDRGTYLQAGMVIRKDSLAEVHEAGLPAFRESIAAVVPSLAEHVSELESWDQIRLLTVQINRLQTWHRPGLLCIGDAAHAMSPAGGVGINLAIQDAVATANFLAEALRSGSVSDDGLHRVQKRRMWPARVIQRFQVILHGRILRGVEDPDKPFRISWLFRVFLLLFGWLIRRIAARLIGIGVRAEHVRTAEYPSHRDR